MKNKLEENWLGNLFWIMFGISFVLVILDFFGLFLTSIYSGFGTMCLMLFFLKSGLFNNLLFEKEGQQVINKECDVLGGKP